MIAFCILAAYFKFRQNLPRVTTGALFLFAQNKKKMTNVSMLCVELFPPRLSVPNN